MISVAFLAIFLHLLVSSGIGLAMGGTLLAALVVFLLSSRFLPKRLIASW